LFFIRHYYHDLLVNKGLIEEEFPSRITATAITLKTFFEEKRKMILFLFIPLSAFNALLLFRKQKLNFSEHCLVAGMILLGLLLINIFASLLEYSSVYISAQQVIARKLSDIFSWISFLYISYGLYNAYGQSYSLLGFLVRLFLFAIFIFIQIILLLLMLILIFHQGEEVNVTLKPLG
jgi:hypothetical protein